MGYEKNKINLAVCCCLFCLLCSVSACTGNSKPSQVTANTPTNDAPAAPQGKDEKERARALELPEGFTIVETSSPYMTVLTPYATYPVYLEEYVPQVLFEGKWGTGPGEFGHTDGFTAEEIGLKEMPTDIALNSKDEIYILDQLNSRIQKFDKTGKYLKSIPVPALADKNGNGVIHADEDGMVYSSNDITGDPYYRVINFVIDYKDNLYFSCFKGKYGEGGREGTDGEVWVFGPDDLLIEKTSRSKMSGNVWKTNNEEASVWMGSYCFSNKTRYTEEEMEKLNKTIQINGFEFTVLKNNNRNLLKVVNIKENDIFYIDIDGTEFDATRLYVYDRIVLLRSLIYKGGTCRYATWSIHDLKGKLVSVYIGNSYGLMHKECYYNCNDANKDGLMIKKYERRKILKKS